MELETDQPRYKRRSMILRHFSQLSEWVSWFSSDSVGSRDLKRNARERALAPHSPKPGLLLVGELIITVQFVQRAHKKWFVSTRQSKYGLALPSMGKIMLQHGLRGSD